MNIDNTAVAVADAAAAAAAIGDDRAALSSLVAGLQRSLSDILEPALYARKKPKYDAGLLHPLALALDAPVLSRVNDTVSQLTRTLASFQAAILDGSNTNTANAAAASQSSSLPLSSNERLRLFALLKEQAGLLQQKHVSRASTAAAERIILQHTSSGRKTASRYPVQVSAGADTVQDVLERIAKECKLEIFAGTAEDEAQPGLDADADAGVDSQDLGMGMQLDADPTAAAAAVAGTGATIARKTTTITMAGKGLVLDVDIELLAGAVSRSGDNDRTAAKGKVLSVRFSHGLEGATDSGVDRLLTRLAQRADWTGLRDSLLRLCALDSLVAVPSSSSESQGEAGTAGPGAAVDPFGAMKALSTRLEQVFEAELEVAAGPEQIFSAGHGLPLLNAGTEPYAALVYHMPAQGLFSAHWERLVSAGFRQPGGAGVRASPDDDKEEETSLLDAGIHGLRSMTFELEPDSPATVQQAENQPPPTLLGQQLPLLQGQQELLEKLEQRISPGLRFVARLDREVCLSAAAGRRLSEVLLGTLLPVTGPSEQQPQPQPQLQLVPGMYALPAEQQTLEGMLLPGVVPGQTYSWAQAQIALAKTGGARGFKIRKLHFRTPAQLMAGIRIMRTQCLLEELLSKAFENTEVSSAGSNIGQQDEANVKLDDLFSGKVAISRKVQQGF